jgi:uncharacterized protein YeeX (DUF496 family)
MRRHIVKLLTDKTVAGDFHTHTDPKSVRLMIQCTYSKIRAALLKRLDEPDITEDRLFDFTDEPNVQNDKNVEPSVSVEFAETAETAETAEHEERTNKTDADSESRIRDLEKRVELLETALYLAVKRLESRINDVEDIALDGAIDRNEQRFDDTFGGYDNV